METINLEHPVTVNGREHTVLKMRRPKVRDLKAAAKGSGDDQDREIALFANLCEVEPAIIEELDMADYTSLQEVYEGFLSRKTKSGGRGR